MNALTWILSVFVIILDQFSKFLVSSTLNLNESRGIIKNIFHITLIHNNGAAFGIFKNQTLFFIFVSAAAIIAIVTFLRREKNTSFLVRGGFLLILGGALGNLIDRLRFGYVIDFLDFRIWPVFNIADSAITMGAFLLVINLLNKTRNSKQTQDSKPKTLF